MNTDSERIKISSDQENNVFSESTKNNLEFDVIKSRISAINKEIQAIFTDLGSKYYEMHQNTENDIYREELDLIRSKLEEKEQYRERIKEIKKSICKNEEKLDVTGTIIEPCENEAKETEIEETDNKDCGETNKNDKEERVVAEDVDEPVLNNMERTYCTNCGKLVPDDSVFCIVCGTRIRRANTSDAINDKNEVIIQPKINSKQIMSRLFCTQCGKELALDAAFCTECGAREE